MPRRSHVPTASWRASSSGMLCLPSGQIRRSRPGVWIGAVAISSVTEPQQLAIAYTPFVSTSPRGDASCTSRSGALATHLRRATHGHGCGELAGPAWPRLRACRSPPIRRHPWCQPRPRFARTTAQAAQLVACAVASAPASRYEFTRILAFTFAFGLDSALGFPFFYAVDRGHG